MSTLALSSIRRVTNAVVKAVIQERDDASSAIIDAGRDLLLITVNGAAPANVAARRNVAHIVAGAIEAAHQTGGDVLIVIRSIVQGTIKGAWESGADVCTVAVKSIGAAVQVAERIGTDPNQAVRFAVDGALRSADVIGAEATGRILDALRSSIQWNARGRQDSFDIAEKQELNCFHG
jgi:hypothetical protein